MWPWILLASFGQTLEPVFPEPIGYVRDQTAAKSVEGPRMGSAKLVGLAQSDISTKALFYGYLEKFIDSGSAFNNLFASEATGAVGTLGLAHNMLTRFAADSEGSVVFEYLGLNDPYMQFATGGHLKFGELDSTQSWINKDVDGNEGGSSTSKACERSRVFRYVRYKRNPDGTSGFEWWQGWITRTYSSGPAGAWTLYKTEGSPYGQLNFIGGVNPQWRAGYSKVVAMPYGGLPGSSVYVVGGGYPVLNATCAAQIYYGTSSTLLGVDDDILVYMSKDFGRKNAAITAANAGKTYYWEHFEDVAYSQQFWWGHAAAGANAGIDLPSDWLGDLINAVEAGMGYDESIPITWTQVQDYKSLTPDERLYYLDHVGAFDLDGDGWSNGFERKHGYSFQSFFDRPGDRDKDGYLDSLDVDMDNDGQPNSTDVDDDGDGMNDADELTAWRRPWVFGDSVLKRRPMWESRIGSAGRVSSTVASDADKAEGIYTYDEWIAECYNELNAAAFRFDDVYPDGSAEVRSSWEPQLKPWVMVEENEVLVDNFYMAGGTAGSESPEEIIITEIPYRAEDAEDHYEDWGPGYQEKPGDGGFDGWGIDDGDWYAPPHKLQSGGGLEDLGEGPAPITLTNMTDRAAEVEQGMFDTWDEIGFMPWIDGGRPLDGEMLDFGGNITFPLFDEVINLPMYLLPDPTTPMGAQIEQARILFRGVFGIGMTITFFWSVFAAFTPLPEGKK